MRVEAPSLVAWIGLDSACKDARDRLAHALAYGAPYSHGVHGLSRGHLSPYAPNQHQTDMMTRGPLRVDTTAINPVSTCRKCLLQEVCIAQLPLHTAIHLKRTARARESLHPSRHNSWLKRSEWTERKEHRAHRTVQNCRSMLACYASCDK